MTASNELFPMPPAMHTDKGDIRHVGVELEMSDIDIDTLSRLVADHVGGTVEKRSRYVHTVTGDTAGDWEVELDFAYLKNKTEAPADELAELAEDIVRFGAEQIVPLEIVSPPLPVDRLPEVNELIRKLREVGASGTGGGLSYAFGLHLNPELPATDAATITRHLQAFLCLYEWLKKRARVDLTRRLTAYIAAYPADYVRLVVDPAYTPDIPDLIDDYLAFNPSRNRALDMLPLFAHLDEKRVRAKVPDKRVKGRPTFHYRLPNCEIDRPGWGIHESWTDWVMLERVAAEPEKLAALCGLYQRYLDEPFAVFNDSWTERVDRWLSENFPR
ncbi:MAG: amidoligase family protein [Oceanibaculum nanhaiense]|jgi:hypothetical protein|uniref:amidoligase family protein n=1 Tax=Oceanibaculum nanhaiense TaxID=1909734 RepID=UPI0032F00B8E